MLPGVLSLRLQLLEMRPLSFESFFSNRDLVGKKNKARLRFQKRASRFWHLFDRMMADRTECKPGFFEISAFADFG
jgi:hypothetical protein